jgi:hypothetical protein
MVESGEIRPIECACGKPFIWTSETEMEVQCHGCRRRLRVPFSKLISRNALVRFVAGWRQKQQRGESPPGGSV